MLSGIAGGSVPTIIYLPYAVVANAGQGADQVLLSCTGDTQTIDANSMPLPKGRWDCIAKLECRI